MTVLVHDLGAPTANLHVVHLHTTALALTTHKAAKLRSCVGLLGTQAMGLVSTPLAFIAERKHLGCVFAGIVEQNTKPMLLVVLPLPGVNTAIPKKKNAETMLLVLTPLAAVLLVGHIYAV